MSFWRTKNSKKITSDSIAVKTDGTTLKDYLENLDVKTIPYTDYITFNNGITVQGCNIYEVGNIVFMNFDIKRTNNTAYSAGEIVVGTCADKLLSWLYGAGRSTDWSSGGSSTNIRPCSVVVIPNGQVKIYTSVSATSFVASVMGIKK